MSDILPNRSGNNTIDHNNSINVVKQIIKISENILINNGILIMKILYQSNINDIIKDLKIKFKYVHIFKPKSSRNESMERFLVCLNYH